MAAEIIPHPRLNVTPQVRLDPAAHEKRRQDAWKTLGTPFEFGGAQFAVWMVINEEFVPRTRDDMAMCLILAHAEAIARHLDAEARETAAKLRRSLEVALA